MKKSMTTYACFVLFFAIAILSLVHSFAVKKTYSLSKQNCILLAEYLAEKIEGEIQKPILLSRSFSAVISKEFFASGEYFENHSSDSEIEEYLSKVKTEFSLAEASFITEKTRTCYSSASPATKIAEDTLGAWYFALKEGRSNGILSVFRMGEEAKDTIVQYTCRVERDGEFLGTMSAAVYARDLIALVKLLEKKYNVKINLSNSTGLVMLDTNFVDIETASLSWLLPKKRSDDAFGYIRTGVLSYAVSGRIGGDGWYFIMRGNVAFSPSQVFYLFAILVFASGLIALYALRKRGKFDSLSPKITADSGQIDSLTGVLNRNFFKDTFGERGVFNTTRYQCLAVFDIDFFKEANDNLNGDKVLVSVVNEMLYLLGNRGMVLRWGGDEFLVLFEMPIENAYAVCRQFVRNTKDSGFVTVSVGLTEVRISDKIKKNYYRAACLCYNVKELGGNGVKRG